jgi:hypothetical protein
MVGGQFTVRRLASNEGKVVGEHEEVKANLWRALVGVEAVGD